MKSVEVIMALHFAELITKEKVSDLVLDLRLTALLKLQSQLYYYAKRGYHDRLISGIAEKKGALILKATTKADMERILHPRPPHYNGAEFVSDESCVPEEELICWSETSLRTPLNSAGMRRYTTLFKEIFPEESKRYGIG